MKILQVNNVYAQGSTGKLVKSLHEGFKQHGHVSKVVFGRGRGQHNQDVIKLSQELPCMIRGLWVRLSGIKLGGNAWSARRLIRFIEKEMFDRVVLHCINGNFVNVYRLVDMLKQRDIPTIMVLHAEFMYTGGCGHSFECDRWMSGCGRCPQLKYATGSWFLDNTAYNWRRMRDAFNGFNRLKVVSVSPWLMERAAKSPILSDFSHSVILNGVDTSVFHYRKDEAEVIRERFPEKKLVMHVTASFTDSPDDIKGGHYVLALANRLRDQPIIFVVAKMNGPQMQLPDNVVDLGTLSDQAELASWYSAADVTLLTSRKETFSMIVAESFCCGTPVVGFEAGAPEMIALSEYSRFVNHGDTEALGKSLISTLQQQLNKTEISEAALKNYSQEVMVEKHISICRELTEF